MNGNLIEQLRRLIVASAQGNKQAENLIIDSFLALTKRTEEAEKKANEANIEVIINNILNKNNIMNLKKEIWEGWTVQDFIDDLEPRVEFIMRGQSFTAKFQDKERLKKWCMDNQPNYKKDIPEVVQYFAEKYNLK